MNTLPHPLKLTQERLEGYFRAACSKHSSIIPTAEYNISVIKEIFIVALKLLIKDRSLRELTYQKLAEDHGFDPSGYKKTILHTYRGSEAALHYFSQDSNKQAIVKPNSISWQEHFSVFVEQNPKVLQYYKEKDSEVVSFKDGFKQKLAELSFIHFLERVKDVGEEDEDSFHVAGACLASNYHEYLITTSTENKIDPSANDYFITGSTHPHVMTYLKSYINPSSPHYEAFKKGFIETMEEILKNAPPPRVEQDLSVNPNNPKTPLKKKKSKRSKKKPLDPPPATNPEVPQANPQSPPVLEVEHPSVEVPCSEAAKKKPIKAKSKTQIFNRFMRKCNACTTFETLDLLTVFIKNQQSRLVELERALIECKEDEKKPVEKDIEGQKGLIESMNQAFQNAKATLLQDFSQQQSQESLGGGGSKYTYSKVTDAFLASYPGAEDWFKDIDSDNSKKILSGDLLTAVLHAGLLNTENKGIVYTTSYSESQRFVIAICAYHFLKTTLNPIRSEINYLQILGAYLDSVPTVFEWLITYLASSRISVGIVLELAQIEFGD
jgi:hypothetical protein